MVTGSDPNTNSFVRVWGAPSRTARRKEKGRAYLVDARRRQRAGRMAPSLAQSSPPVEETRGMRESETEKGKGEGGRGPGLSMSGARAGLLWCSALVGR